MRDPNDQSDFNKLDWEIEKSRWKVDSKDFQRIKKIASGGQGDVFICKQISTNKNVIMKKTQNSLKNLDTQRYFNREIQILAKYRHPAIVQFIGYDEVKFKNKLYGCIYLLMMDKGSLQENIEKNNKEGEKDPFWDNTRKFIITYGVACAMEYLHNNNIIHRDLKSDNILLDSQLRPYITDFGSAKDIIVGNSIHQTIQSTTLIIMAPEFLENYKKYKNTLPIDAYAFGITMCHLWTGIYPFSSYSTSYAITKAVMSGARPEITNSVPKNIANLIKRCWSQAPEDRPTFTKIINELLSDSFINENSQKDFIHYKTQLDEYRTKRPSSKSPEKNVLVRLSTNGLKPSTEPPSKRYKGKITLKPSFLSRESPVLQNLISATKEGNLTAEFELALALYRGTYGDVDKDGAFTHFCNVANRTTNSSEQKAAEYYTGISLIESENYSQAKKFLKRARDHGNADAAYTLAELISSGKIMDNNFEFLFSLYEMAANNAEIVKIEAIRKLVSLILNGKALKQSRNRKQVAYDYIYKGSLLGDYEMMYKYSKILEYGMGGVQKNIPEAMKLLELLEFKYIPAQIDFALHLLNGYHVEKNTDHAEIILEDASNKEDPFAMLYYSMIIEKDEDRLEEANEYFEKSRDSNLVPEAWVVHGQKLVESGDYEYALEPLYFGMEAGSYSAFITYGNICENDSKYGDPAFFFKCASYRCHALDTCGFYFPFKHNVYHCNDCGIDICEGCAKHCHSGHEINLVDQRLGCDFKCKCGEKGFTTSPHLECTAEYIAGCDFKCQKCNSLYQHLYQCETCCPKTENIYICKSCIANCHSGHTVIDCGIQNGVCSCGLRNIPNNFKCSLLKGVAEVDNKECSAVLNADAKIYQRWFQCFNCKLFGNDNIGICKVCAENCHGEHRYVDLGYNNFNCTCYESLQCDYIHD